MTRDLSTSRLMTSRTSVLGTLIVDADGLDSFELAAADEDRQPSEQASLVFEEEVVAPVHDGTQRLLAGQRGAGAAGEQRVVVVEPLGQRGQGEDSEAGGGKLNGQRQAVEPTADAADDAFGRAVAFEAWLHGTSPIHEEFDSSPGDANPDTGMRISPGIPSGSLWWPPAEGRVPFRPGCGRGLQPRR